MRLTPRRDEVQAVVKLLESTDYDSAEALAKDVIKAVATSLSERVWYAYAWRSSPGAPVLAWGPLTSEAEVQKFAKAVDVDGEHLAVKLYSVDAMLEHVDKQAKGLTQYCATCKHPKGAHEHPKMTGRCAVGDCACKAVS